MTAVGDLVVAVMELLLEMVAKLYNKLPSEIRARVGLITVILSFGCLICLLLVRFFI